MAQTNRKSQRMSFLVMFLISSLLGVLIWNMDNRVGLFWFFGLTIGVVLQRSKFCIAASFRDLILFQMGGMARGLLISILVSTIGFFAIRIWAMSQGLAVPGNFDAVGWHTVVGAFLFGVGMVVAGGCASGTLMRMGEGYLLQWLVFLGLIIGSVAGSWHYTWWEQGRIILLDKVIGLCPALIGQIVFIGLLYYAIIWWENRT